MSFGTKLKNLWLVCLVILLLWAPDYIYQCIDDKYKVLSMWKPLKFIIPLSIGARLQQVSMDDIFGYSFFVCSATDAILCDVVFRKIFDGI